MSIHDFKAKIKALGKEHVFIWVVIVFVGLGSFFLGKISNNTLDNEKVTIVNSNREGNLNKESLNIKPKSDNSSLYVASKNGKMYYRVGCGASSRILPENQIFFQTAEDAEGKGYEASTSCTP